MIKFFGRVAIRWKIILVALLTTVAVLVAVAAAIFTYDSVSFRRRMVRDTIVLANMLEVSCAQAVVFDDPRSAEEALSTLKAQSQVVAAAVYGKEGNVFATYMRSGLTGWEPPKVERSGHRFEKDHLALFKTMEFGRKEVGSVYLFLDMTALAARKADYAKILTVDLLAAILLAFFLSSKLQHLISGPILRLVGVTKEVSEKKDYSLRAQKETSDEIGLLMDGFNHMLVEVEKRDVDLQDKNEKLREQGEELRQKNEQILDSIRYAQHIQASILPLPEYLSAALPDHFVIFRPCHIVSGDFYWCHRSNGRVFLAVVDCTGHGVPGAFMSMIGGSLLRGVVVEKGLTDPAKILEHLNTGVRETLQQTVEHLGAQDGMDVCLCVVDEESGSVSFAGAKRPLYVVKVKGDAEPELVELKGDRSSIGGRGETRSYSTKIVETAPGDMIYLTTDGYSDQNGTTGKRFGAEPFKTLLRSIAKGPAADQRQRLELALDTHQGTEKQRDDITVVGVRIQPGKGTP
ncbi:MAG: SpoIIE family protein phosphatase [Thermoanaerobaculia bacterium]|nr:hypothetical protein [Thermoanaerobaculia bacterium]MCK6681170.1 SpoIIE family protein phosphatase [Thermoanaerobaculia bacterium]